tara:strand:+ start:325 stop:615 length:291 start_codon:yes stop_codon:yes gene_type:complete
MKDNKLIAEFMGLPTEVFKPSRITNYYHREYNSGTWYEEHELSYNVSWDWLMPVVEKCYDNGADENEVGDITHALLDCDIDHTYRAVVEFINQLNR